VRKSLSGKKIFRGEGLHLSLTYVQTIYSLLEAAWWAFLLTGNGEGIWIRHVKARAIAESLAERKTKNIGQTETGGSVAYRRGGKAKRRVYRRPRRWARGRGGGRLEKTMNAQTGGIRKDKACSWRGGEEEGESWWRAARIRLCIISCL